MILADNRGRRSGIDRRRFYYALHVPERRVNPDRRSGLDRRSGNERRINKDQSAGVERRSGIERRVTFK